MKTFWKRSKQDNFIDRIKIKDMPRNNPTDQFLPSTCLSKQFRVNNLVKDTKTDNNDH